MVSPGLILAAERGIRKHAHVHFAARLGQRKCGKTSDRNSRTSRMQLPDRNVRGNLGTSALLLVARATTIGTWKPLGLVISRRKTAPP